MNPMFIPYLIRLLTPVIVIMADSIKGDSSAIVGVVGTIVGSLLGSLATLAVTLVTLSYQKSMQRFQIASQTQLRARELLFDSYQRKIETSFKQLAQHGATLGQLEGGLEELSKGRGKQLRPFVACLAEQIPVYKIHVNSLEQELKNTGLFEERKLLLDKIKDVLNTNLVALTDAEIGARYRNLLSFSATMSALEHDLIEHKAEELFRPFI